jgi:ATP adenylyltransferase
MLTDGTLWGKLVRASQRALGSGAQQPIPTDFRIVKDKGIPFIVRIVERLARKRTFPEEATVDAESAANPFLPYDPAMFVADISPTHVGLLNKYNVVDHHLLIVTRRFEPQESLLTVADFEALWKCMREFPSLGFYNSGSRAGASQPHKHLQIVPLPLSDQSPCLPIESILDRDRASVEAGRVQALPFAHLFTEMETTDDWTPSQLAARTSDRYETMLKTLGLMSASGDREDTPLHYNLLVTRNWMMLVPRSRECFGSISLNALAFAGTFLVRDEEKLRELEDAGPMAALQHVGVPMNP